jgi:hypothetical protein
MARAGRAESVRGVRGRGAGAKCATARARWADAIGPIWPRLRRWTLPDRWLFAHVVGA